MATEIERFVAAHPVMTEVYAADVQQGAFEWGWPFCNECCDWHLPSEPHVEVTGVILP